MNEKDIFFEGFLLPVLPGLTYRTEYICCKTPQEVFILDDKKRFHLSLAAGMKCIDLLPFEDSPTDFGETEQRQGDRYIHLRYPLQVRVPKASVGYFHVELTDGQGEIHTLPGQLSLRRPKKYINGLRDYTALHELFAGIRLATPEEQRAAQRTDA